MLTCLDARVDPGHFAGIDLGDAFVMRNVGGRVTDTVMLEVAVLWQLMKLGSGRHRAVSWSGRRPSHQLRDGQRFARAGGKPRSITAKSFGTPGVVDTYAITDVQASA